MMPLNTQLDRLDCAISRTAARLVRAKAENMPAFLIRLFTRSHWKKCYRRARLMKKVRMN